MAQQYVSDVLKMDHAFGNIFNVVVSQNTTPSLMSLGKTASKVSFGDSTGFTTDFNKAIQSHVIKSPSRIKSVTITFLERKDYSIRNWIKKWMSSIYDFKNRHYQSNITTGKIEIIDIYSEMVYTITEVLPTSLKYPSYSWSESNVMEIQATFSINGDVKRVCNVNPDNNFYPAPVFPTEYDRTRPWEKYGFIGTKQILGESPSGFIG